MDVESGLAEALREALAQLGLMLDEKQMDGVHSTVSMLRKT